MLAPGSTLAMTFLLPLELLDAVCSAYRLDHADVIYRTEEAKFLAVVEDLVTEMPVVA